MGVARGEPWTADEDAVVEAAALENYRHGVRRGDAPLPEAARLLDRTYVAVLHRAETIKARSFPGNGPRPRNRWHGGRKDVHKWTEAEDAEPIAVPAERGNRSTPTALALFAARVGVSVEAARTRRKRLRDRGTLKGSNFRTFACRQGGT